MTQHGEQLGDKDARRRTRAASAAAEMLRPQRMRQADLDPESEDDLWQGRSSWKFYADLIVVAAGWTVIAAIVWFTTPRWLGWTVLIMALLGWVYVAIGAFASSITRSQIIAFLISLVLLLVILLLPAVADLGVAAGAPWIGDLCRYLSANAHLEQLVSGIVDTGDLAYFAVMIATFALMTKASVESARWR